MKIRVLASALQDLAEGRRFYDQQGEGLGDSFLDSLFSDVDSLALYGSIHREIFGFRRLLSNDSPMPFTINSTPTGGRWFTACSSAAKNQPGRRPR